MSPRGDGFQSLLADALARFLAHTRTLGRRYASEERELRLFDRSLVRHGPLRLAAITPDLLETFLAARPRPRPRS
jgi:hypothetical protein